MTVLTKDNENNPNGNEANGNTIYDSTPAQDGKGKTYQRHSRKYEGILLKTLKASSLLNCLPVSSTSIAEEQTDKAFGKRRYYI
ncbi:hypothetical protein [Phocaeicola barnesiae]|uniref:hypothetical protein n=1 Tax=Phocaeicola barnesiae TaxID=376804 RepID=UPI0025A381E2|nr:hypothetical protein [Phocaeicola barnesiae]MDM8310363.1 hypothetical protein [Phocaeicola barnesiae]